MTGLTGYQAATLMARIVTAGALAGVALIMATPRPASPLIAPPRCEGKPDVGVCSLDLSDGREYVIYTDPTTGRLAWYEQDWRDGNP